MAILLSPVTAISRPTMRATIHADALSRLISMMSAVTIKSLSASGSRNLPRVVTSLLLSRQIAVKPVGHTYQNEEHGAKDAQVLPGFMSKGRAKGGYGNSVL